ncbi:MAG: 2-hydroxyacyl-CoA dehydratase [Candidatus Tectomicrobia bacterium]|uniref:2-hydroxyacyl-CoA dehydratase n=1 Tax=Tectimicrobiota bacterium TaxID=2528274 RepID=A0A932CRN0_UNCTE|nr:2-hydroxyacyl-CoA dehydratase [Candidatus Tectomicrobia bacterium]
MTVAIEAKETMGAMCKVLENILDHRKARPTLPSEQLYYEMVLNYFNRITTAREQGRPIVGHTVMAPTEIFYAMDLAPMSLENVACMQAILLNKYEDYLGTARSFGLAPETCSAHRMLAGAFLNQMVTSPDMIIWSNLVCDNTAKSGDALMDIYGIPGFFLDRPYKWNEEGVRYYTSQTEELVQFLEKHTGRKLDEGKLKEAVVHSNRVIEIYREIYELRKARPAPMRNRNLMNQNTIEGLFSGTPEAVTYFEQVRDEIKANVQAGRGVAEEERYRPLFLFLPPFYELKILDWLERDQGAVSVMEPFISYYAPGEMDPNKPIESIARKAFFRHTAQPMHGPSEAFVDDALRIAKEFGADGAVYFAHIGCRQACALIRTLKDRLKEELDVPTLVVDIDIMDPSLSSGAEIKDKFERFFEILEDRK